MATHPPGAPQPQPYAQPPYLGFPQMGGPAPYPPRSQPVGTYNVQPTYGQPQYNQFPTNIEPWTPCPGNKTMYDGPDMATQDLPEHQEMPEPQVMPPDVSKLAPVRGYEGLGYYGGGDGKIPSAPPIPPPSYDSVVKPAAGEEPKPTSSVAQLSEEQVREALAGYAGEHCCYGKGAVSSMNISKVTPSSALHYKLETFTETRTTTWEQEPYRGQPVDTPVHGAAPLPWDIAVQPPEPFTPHCVQLEVPHTACVNPCHGCGAMGFLRCTSCFGRGFKRCMHCHGHGRNWDSDAHGHRHHSKCHMCHGSGRKRCFKCQGDGRIMCKTCQGYRNVKQFIKLIVEFKNHLSERIVEKTDLPNKLIKKVGGVEILQQTLPRVFPIRNYPEAEVNQISQELIQSEAEKHRKARIVMQKQILKAVPVTEVEFDHKGKEGRFWVYGNECKVYTKQYPQKCCWGCVIL